MGRRPRFSSRSQSANRSSCTGGLSILVWISDDGGELDGTTRRVPFVALNARSYEGSGALAMLAPQDE